MQFVIKPDLERFPHFIPPERATSKSAGFDLFAQEDMIITGDTVLFDLGFRTKVPKDHVAIIVPRSGLGAKFNVQLANTVGVIDEDYTGTWMAALQLGGRGTKVNELDWLSTAYKQSSLEEIPDLDDNEEMKALLIRHGDAFAQVLFLPVPKVEVVITHGELEQTERGEGGFGSTTKSRG